MRHRKLLAGIAVGSLAALGGFGFGPGNSNADTPEEAENGCSGIEEAQDRLDEDNPAADILDQVEELLAGEEGCDDGPASDRGGDNGEGRP
jgi:hypothetical protein